MRSELENIEKIERWLDGSLGAADKADFEKQMASDPVLREQVMLQQDLYLGMERALLRSKVQAAGIRAGKGRNFRSWGTWGSAGLGLLIVAAVVLYLSNRHWLNEPAAQTISRHGDDTVPRKAVRDSSVLSSVVPSSPDSSGAYSDTAGNSLPMQLFSIDADKDTVIETRGGMVLAIPAGSWLDEAGRRTAGKIEFMVREALDRASIIRSGLTSRSREQLLESGGMFEIDARQNGKALKIEPGSGLYAEVPTDTIKPAMQLYYGVRERDGSLDWEHPAPLSHDLMPVDILSLDFYPPHYLDSVSRWGYDARNKVFTDSLYYSSSFTGELKADSTTRFPENEGYLSRRLGDTVSDTTHLSPDVLKRYYDEMYIHCGIDPARIKAIWGHDFQQTLLATQEFGKRIGWIHRSHKEDILDLYVHHLDQRLSRIDSMAADRLTGTLRMQFLAFAARKDGKVNMSAKQARLLGAYYEKKARVFAVAIRKTQTEFWNKQAELDNLAATIQAGHYRDSTDRAFQHFNAELVLNLKEACKQLGYGEPANFLGFSTAITENRGARPDQVYQVQVRTTGWCNIDRAVMETLLARSTLHFTDQQSGRSADIAFQEVSFRIKRSMDYDRLYVYLLPDKFSSFQRLTGKEGVFQYRLNSLMKYELVVLGYKGEHAFYYSAVDLRPGNYFELPLRPIGNTELTWELNKTGNGSQAQGMQKDLDFLRFDAGDQRRKNDNETRSALRAKLMKFIYPCFQPADQAAAPNTVIPKQVYQAQ